MRRLQAVAEKTATGTILVVDDLDANVHLLEHLLGFEGYTVLTAGNGDAALRVVATGAPDIVLMDVRMPGLDGFATCEILKRQPETRLIPVVLMTGSAGREERVRAIDVGADDFLTKPVDQAELKARIRSLLRLKRYTDELDSAESVILTMARTIEARDPSTEGHCDRLSRYAVALGRRLCLPEDDLAALHRGGILHDIGKIAVPDAILMKPGPLTVAEFETMKRHTVIGERLCGGLRVLARVRPIVRHHHERLDGSGYPDSLVGAAIPRLAQVMGVVDVFDALTTWRPYKEAQSVMVALDHLRWEAAVGWRDPRLVDTFASLMREPQAGQLLDN